MQQWFQAVLTLNLFFLCINLGFAFIGGIYDNAFEIAGTSPASMAGRSVNFTTLGQNVNNTVNQLNSTGGGFNTAFIFGDFGKAISMFMNAVGTGVALLSGGYIVADLGRNWFP